MKRPWLGWLLAALSILIFSTNTPVARGIILEGFHPLTLAVLRFVLSALLVCDCAVVNAIRNS